MSFQASKCSHIIIQLISSIHRSGTTENTSQQTIRHSFTALAPVKSFTMQFSTTVITVGFALSVSASKGTPVPVNAVALPTSDPRVSKSNAKPEQCFDTAMKIPACGVITSLPKY